MGLKQVYIADKVQKAGEMGLKQVYIADKVQKAGEIRPNPAQNLEIHLLFRSRDLFTK
jgi:hypothetical protein